MAVEDAVASAPEDIHAVLVEHLPDGESLVAVVGKAWLKDVLHTLSGAGIRPSRLVAESELAALRAAAERTDPWLVVRTHAGGFVVSRNAALGTLDVQDEPGRVPFALRRLREDHAAQGTLPDEIIVFGSEGLPDPDLRIWGRVLQLPVRSGGVWRPEDMDARRAASTDLLRGGFSPGGGALQVPRALKAAGIAAALLAAVHVALTIGDWARVSFESSTIRSHMEAEFRRLFPETTAVVDAPLQLQRRVADLRRSSGAGDASDLLPLLAAVSPALGAMNAQAERLRYERGELELEVLFPAGEARSAIEQKLAVPGYRVRIEKLAREANGQVAVLRVSAGS
jgi:general secretion pathway protein L